MKSYYNYEYRIFSECGPKWKNEDTAAAVNINMPHEALFIVCDGMGGHKNGDIASRTIVGAFTRFWEENVDYPLCKGKIINAAEYAMAALSDCPFQEGGTTMAMIAIQNNRLYTAHCGDSRIYYCFSHYDRSNVIAGHLRDHILLTPEGWPYVAKGFVRNDADYIPEIHEFKTGFRQGDRFLICSDGVYNSFNSNEITDLLKSHIDIDELRDTIYERCKKSARDNYSAIIIQFT